MSGDFCPNCDQQVSPGTTCWSCGTRIPRSPLRMLANAAACLTPFLFCLIFMGLGALMSALEDRTPRRRPGRAPIVRPTAPTSPQERPQ